MVYGGIYTEIERRILYTIYIIFEYSCRVFEYFVKVYNLVYIYTHIYTRGIYTPLSFSLSLVENIRIFTIEWFLRLFAILYSLWIKVNLKSKNLFIFLHTLYRS